MMKPRKTPCASCPYRQDVPSGVWAESEYDKLPLFDGSTTEQAVKHATGVFMCHNNPEQDICAGWSAVHGNHDSFALRMAPHLDKGVDVQAVLDYTTDVPLWRSGAEAAEHGKRDIEAPSEDAGRTIDKITIVRSKTGIPVTGGREKP